MLRYLLLAIPFACFVYGQSGSASGSATTQVPVPAFLANVTAAQQQAFLAIVQNASLSKNQVIVDLGQWAQGIDASVKPAFDQYLTDYANSVSSAQTALTSAASGLSPSAQSIISQLINIQNDQSISIATELQQVTQLLTGLTDSVFAELQGILPILAQPIGILADVVDSVVNLLVNLLGALTDDQKNALLQIVANTNLTKDQLDIQLNTWLLTLDVNAQADVSNLITLIQNLQLGLQANITIAVLGQSVDVQAIVNVILNLLNDGSITRIDEITGIVNALTNLTGDVLNDITSILPLNELLCGVGIGGLVGFPCSGGLLGGLGALLGGPAGLLGGLGGLLSGPGGLLGGLGGLLGGSGGLLGGVVALLGGPGGLLAGLSGILLGPAGILGPILGNGLLSGLLGGDLLGGLLNNGLLGGVGTLLGNVLSGLLTGLGGLLGGLLGGPNGLLGSLLGSGGLLGGLLGGGLLGGLLGGGGSGGLLGGLLGGILGGGSSGGGGGILSGLLKRK